VLVGLQAAQHCRFERVDTQLLDTIAAKLATSRIGLSEAMQPVALEALGTPPLAELLIRLAASMAFCPVLDVRLADVGNTGGFTFALYSFSEQEGTCYSPWVVVGGMGWRLRVYPQGRRQCKGRQCKGRTSAVSCSAQAACVPHCAVRPASTALQHLAAHSATQHPTTTPLHCTPHQLIVLPAPCTAAYLEWNGAAAAAAGVASASASFFFTVIDQREGGQDSATHITVYTFPGKFSNWGWRKTIRQSELRAAGRGFLAHDRLLLRVDITIASIQRAPVGA
jgi:hypothetical protein